jgi:beta-lactamase regulating signal transducer with metallopeptidase domain
MLINDLAVTMNLIAIALLGFFVAAVLLFFAWSVLGRLVETYSIQSQRTLIWLWALGPWILGLTTMLIFSPLFEATALYKWIESLAHWHHLYVFQLDSWHGMTVILFVLCSIGIIIVKGTQLYRQSNALYSLKHFLSPESLTHNNQRVLFIDSSVCTAFTSGIFKPMCYVSKGLAENLNPTELDIVIEHELAHARNKDTLTRLCIAFLSAYYPKKFAIKLNAKYALITEHIADQSTVLKHSAEDVAATLLKVVRLQKPLPVNDVNTSLNYFGANDITQRIQQLLTPSKKSMPRLIPIVFMLLMLSFTVVAVDATHHIVESVFTHS